MTHSSTAATVNLSGLGDLVRVALEKPTKRQEPSKLTLEHCLFCASHKPVVDGVFVEHTHRPIGLRTFVAHPCEGSGKSPRQAFEKFMEMHTKRREQLASPSGQYAGLVMEEIAGLPRHCEAPLPNSTCSYLALGCLGCTFKHVLTIGVK